MHVTMLALGSTGDILPIAALGRRLILSGHKVLFITTEDYTNRLKQLELDVLSIPGDARALISGNGAKIITLFREFAKVSRALTQILDPEEPRIQQTDLIVNQIPLGLYGYDLAEKLDVPFVHVGVIPLTPTQDYPLMGWPGGSLEIGTYNRLSFRLYEQVTWWYMRPVINKWRSECLELLPRPFSRYWHNGSAGRPDTIYGFSPLVLHRPADWDDRVKITGYWLPYDESWQPSVELHSFVEEGDPPLFLGFGSMPVKDPRKMSSLVIEALQKTEKRAILHSGWADLLRENLPETLFSVDYASYRWLFPKMSAVIHHGGSGTTGFALWAGVPNLAVPFLFDQKFWGERVEKLGVGPKPIPFRKLTVRNLAEAIDRMSGDAQMIQNAQDLGKKIQAESGLDDACLILESFAH
jgi:UDP:flavonoid glycosyltransferase YjiC (YdhE family)